jgi:histidinol-phosphate phosphatase family protein
MTKTLFLDRDGVINFRTPGDYVRSPEMFVPTTGLDEALQLLSQHFERLVVATNQAGIGRGLMTEQDLAAVHAKMFSIAAAAGGRIDRVYWCPHAKDAGCRCRKPATGMAWLALADFPDIDFENAWLVGDSASDIAFGQALGMRTVLINGKEEEAEQLAGMKIDFRFDSLLAFARFFDSGAV